MDGVGIVKAVKECERMVIVERGIIM